MIPYMFILKSEEKTSGALPMRGKEVMEFMGNVVLIWRKQCNCNNTAGNYLDHSLICLQESHQSIRIMSTMTHWCLKKPHIAALKSVNRHRGEVTARWFMWDFLQTERRIKFNEWRTAPPNPSRPPRPSLIPSPCSLFSLFASLEVWNV